MADKVERRQPAVPLLSAADEQRIRELDGFHVGLLTDDEHSLFERAVLSGIAKRSYDDVAGFLGLAKVRVL